MELRQLQYLVAVADEGSFTRAAALMHVAQPGISAQIKQLEREFGEALFDRSGRTVTLTEAGRVAVPHARAALAAVAGARVEVSELSGLLHGQVRVGMVVACASLELTGLLDAFHRDHPGITLSLAEAASDEMIAHLLDGELDAAWIGIATPTPPALSSIVVADDPMVAVVSDRPEAPWAARRQVKLPELVEQRLICMPEGTGIRAGFDAACAAAGVSPRIGLEATSAPVLLDLARRGLGVAVVAESIAALSPNGIRALRIVGPSIRSRLEFAWRAEGASPAARAFVRYAQRELTAV